MNIFEHLGLKENHRPKNKVVQLVKHWDEVNPRSDEGFLHKELSFPMFGQVKKDGIFAAIVVELHQCSIFSRTGGKLSNVSHLERLYSRLSDGVYFAEITANGFSLEELSGALSSERVNPLANTGILQQLQAYFFDLVTIAEFKQGFSGRNYSTRYSLLMKHCLGFVVLPIACIGNRKELDHFAASVIDRGEEGAVFKPNVGWLAGAKDWHQMKKVRKYEVDLLCTGIEEGSGKYAGKVANLLFKYKGGKTVKAMLGKGWTHSGAEELFLAHLGNSENNPVGKIYRVYGLQPSSKNGVIRLPKVGDERFDKSEADF